MWRNTAELRHVVMIIHGPADDAAVQQIIEEYKRRFEQQSVLRVRGRVHAGF